MNADAARAIALAAHGRHTTRHGEPLIAHLSRVAAAVPPPAAATAWLHELGEHGAVSAHDLRAMGVTATELGALELLTIAEGEDFRLYVRRIVRAPGAPGELARTVKLAELADHLARLPSGSSWARRYRWARDQIERRRRRSDPRFSHQRVELA